MALKLFNTLSRSLEEFSPRSPNVRSVDIYCCGPTVHNFAHIGNFRTFVFSDLLRRYLEFCGYQVRQVMNVTDVEDKIIAGLRQSNAALTSYTKQYEAAFFEDCKTLGCLLPHHTPRATEHIGEIVALIERLMAQGLAYRAADGSVYFSIEKYRASGHKYGQLLNLNFDEMRAGERVSADEYDKEAIGDFALWKARVADDGAVFWPAPWGEGRPGWHIECSAMSMRLLGPSFDIHLGGEDLIFPHHEDEIAQSEGAGLQAKGERFVKYWLHAAHLLVEGKKMSKTLGNFFTLRDLLAKGFSGREIRYLLLTAHYRAPFNFTLDNLTGGRTSLARLDECLAKLRERAKDLRTPADSALLEAFRNAMDDDLNVAAAWGAIFEWVRETNRLLAAGQLTPNQAAQGLAAWEQIDSVFAVGMKQDATAPPEITALMIERENARRAKDFKASDRIRDQLKQAGWVVEDTPGGPRLKRASGP